MTVSANKWFDQMTEPTEADEILYLIELQELHDTTDNTEQREAIRREGNYIASRKGLRMVRELLARLHPEFFRTSQAERGATAVAAGKLLDLMEDSNTTPGRFLASFYPCC